MTEEEIALSAKLTKNEERLNINIREMAAGLDRFRFALRDIYNTECWRVRGAAWTTFDEFCEQRLRMNRSRAYQLIRAENAKQTLLAAFSDLPDMAAIAQNMPEGALREVSALPDEKMVTVVVEAVKTQGKATGSALKKAKVSLGMAKAVDADYKMEPKITPSQWVDVGRKCPLFMSWWEHLSETEQEEVLAYLKSKP